MPLVELIATKGALDGAAGTRVKERLLAEVMAVEGAPDTEAARAISWLVVHEPDTWLVGGAEPAATDPPRYVVRISVPAGSLDDTKRAAMAERVTALLAELDDEPDRLRERPDAWIHLIEIADGNWGAFGRVVRLPDVVSYVTTGSLAAAPA